MAMTMEITVMHTMTMEITVMHTMPMIVTAMIIMLMTTGMTMATTIPIRIVDAARNMASISYLRDPAAIYRESFATIRREVDLSVLPTSLHGLAVRLIHAVGDTSILHDLCWSEDVAYAGRAALAAGARILVDAAMVGQGITRARLGAANEVVCTLANPDTAPLAATLATTRSAAAVDLWLPYLSGAVVAIGNAPTALFRLLELLDSGAAPPGVILAFPVGFVGAAESKEALIARDLRIPFITLKGRRGGSALAAAAVNALAGPAHEGLEEKT